MTNYKIPTRCFDVAYLKYEEIYLKKKFLKNKFQVYST